MKTKVITLCGSSRFKPYFKKENIRLTMAGHVVLSLAVWGHYDNVSLTVEEKALLDKVHFNKIKMSDEIRVINVDGYIGNSTKREIEYAKKLGKEITYLWEEQDE